MKPAKPYAPKKLNTLQAWVHHRIQQNKPFVIRGKDTRAPQDEWDVLSTRNLKAMLFFDPDDMVIGVQAGMGSAELQACINEKAMFLPINPWYPDSTIGSVIACNDFGPTRMNGGGLRDCIIGIEYINGRGELVKAGGKVVKNVTGYDLSRMMLGSVGGLGVITAVNFKISPKPAGSRVMYHSFEKERWLEKVRQLHEKRIPVDWIEAITTPSGWVLGIGFSGIDARLNRIETELRAIFSQVGKGADQSLQVQEEGQLPRGISVLPGQHRFSGFLSPVFKRFKLRQDYLHLHAVVPTGDLLAPLPFQALVEHGAQLVVHPIGGDFHVVLNDENLASQQALLTMLKTTLKGTEAKLTLVHATPGLPVHELNDFAIPKAYALMKAIKQQLDPANIFQAPFYDY